MWMHIRYHGRLRNKLGDEEQLKEGSHTTKEDTQGLGEACISL
jgi:hypothetical protein